VGVQTDFPPHPHPLPPWEREKSAIFKLIEWTLLSIKPFVLSLSKYERLSYTPFDKTVLGKPFTLREPQGER
jgi:hypothetical protein